MKRNSVLIAAALMLSSCAGQSFGSIASTVLNSGGFGSSSSGGSSVEAFFTAGQNLIEAATPLTEEQEYYLGRGVSASILSRYRPLNNDGVQRYVGRVGRTVAAFSDRPDTFKGYRFLVIDTKDINAMAAPSGFIFISRGLLQQTQSEDELAGVLAHEVAHVVYSHGVKAVSQSKLTKAVTIIGKEVAAEYTPALLSEVTDMFTESVDEITETLLTSGYSRSQEYSADEYAVTLLTRAGYDPSALRRVLERLTKVGASTKEMGGWYATHPDPEDRVESLDDPAPPSPLLQTGIRVRTARFNGSLQGVR